MPPKPPLLALPTEVRYMIFDLLISQPHTIVFKFQQPTKPETTNTPTYTDDDVEGFGPLRSLERTCSQLRDEIYKWLPTRPDLTITTAFGIFDAKITTFDFFCIEKPITSSTLDREEPHNVFQYPKLSVQQENLISSWYITALSHCFSFYRRPEPVERPTPVEIRKFIFWKECCREAGTSDLVAVTDVILSRLHEMKTFNLLRDLLDQYVGEEDWYETFWKIILPNPRFVCDDEGRKWIAWRSAL